MEEKKNGEGKCLDKEVWPIDELRRKKREIFETVMTDKHTDRISSCRLLGHFCGRVRGKREVIFGIQWNGRENFDICWNKLIRKNWVSRDLDN